MNSSVKRTYDLIRYYTEVEYRRPAALAGIGLFAVATVFLVYKGFNSITNDIWNVLFWVILLFVSINATLKSFSEEAGRKSIYFYSIWDPYEVLVSKVIYNFLLITGLALLVFGLLSLFFESPIQHYDIFAGNLLLSSFGISVCFSFVSAVASQGKQSSILLAILGIPAVIPIFMISIKISADAIGLIRDSTLSTDFMLLGGIDILLFATAMFLFPSLWKS